MSGRKRSSSSKKGEGASSAAVEFPVLTTEVVQHLITLLSNAIRNQDIKTIRKASYIIEDFVDHESADEKIRDMVTPQVQKMLEQGQHIVHQWLRGLKLGDAIEVFEEGEHRWYTSKVVSEKVLDDHVMVHYNGWDSKYDRLIDIKIFRINPVHTFVPEAKQHRASDAAELTQPQDGATTNASSSSSEVGSTPKAEETEIITSKSGRVLKVITKPTTGKDAEGSTGKKEKKSAKKKDAVEKDHNDWTCSICNMLEAPLGTDLILCDGMCCRSFHVECLDGKGPKADSKDDDKWLCIDCVNGAHTCFICCKRGLDYLEVMKCADRFCGKFYHKKCLEKGAHQGDCLGTTFTETTKVFPADDPHAKRIMNANIKVKDQEGSFTVDPTDGHVEVTTTSFRCPLHYCDTCFNFYGSVDTSDLCPCTYCPRAFHTNCIPPGARYNSICMVCPLHPLQPLPGQAITANPMGSNKESEFAANVNLFFDQITVPDIAPDVNQPLDNHFRLQLYIREEVESTPQNFKLIYRNNYDKLPEEKMPQLILPDTGCDCKVECDENCFNRAMRIECCEMRTASKDCQVCGVGVKACSNRLLQKKEYAGTKVFKEGNMGLGLKATEFIPKDTLVIEYMGEIIDEDEMGRRLHNQRTLTPNDKDYYIMELDNGIYVDGKFEGNFSRFINHSCDPNCELQRWNVKGRMRIGIFSIKDIKNGEPLSYDYQFDTQEEDVFKCYCGTTKCRGTMAPNKKDRLARLAQDGNKAGRDARQKLIQLGMNKEKKTVEARMEDEWTRSYTGKTLPGDTVYEIRNGPAKNTFPLGYQNRIFLVRNVNKGTNFLRRRDRFIERATTAAAAAGSKRKKD